MIRDPSWCWANYVIENRAGSQQRRVAWQVDATIVPELLNQTGTIVLSIRSEELTILLSFSVLNRSFPFLFFLFFVYRESMTQKLSLSLVKWLTRIIKIRRWNESFITLRAKLSSSLFPYDGRKVDKRRIDEAEIISALVVKWLTRIIPLEN